MLLVRERLAAGAHAASLMVARPCLATATFPEDMIVHVNDTPVVVSREPLLLSSDDTVVVFVSEATAASLMSSSSDDDDDDDDDNTNKKNKKPTAGVEVSLMGYFLDAYPPSTDVIPLLNLATKHKSMPAVDMLLAEALAEAQLYTHAAEHLARVRPRSPFYDVICGDMYREDWLMRLEAFRSACGATDVKIEEDGDMETNLLGFLDRLIPILMQGVLRRPLFPLIRDASVRALEFAVEIVGARAAFPAVLALAVDEGLWGLGELLLAKGCRPSAAVSADILSHGDRSIILALGRTRTKELPSPIVFRDDPPRLAILLDMLLEGGQRIRIDDDDVIRRGWPLSFDVLEPEQQGEVRERVVRGAQLMMADQAPSKELLDALVKVDGRGVANAVLPWIPHSLWSEEAWAVVDMDFEQVDLLALAQVMADPYTRTEGDVAKRVRDRVVERLGSGSDALLLLEEDEEVDAHVLDQLSRVHRRWRVMRLIGKLELLRDAKAVVPVGEALLQHPHKRVRALAHEVATGERPVESRNGDEANAADVIDDDPDKWAGHFARMFGSGSLDDVDGGEAAVVVDVDESDDLSDVERAFEAIESGAVRPPTPLHAHDDEKKEDGIVNKKKGMKKTGPTEDAAEMARKQLARLLDW